MLCPPKTALLLLLILPAFFARLAAQQSDSDALEPWRQASLSFVEEASESFRKRAGAAQVSRRDLYGRAVTLINVAPKEDGKTQEAAEIFRKLAEGSSQDEVGLASRFYLARIQQFHQSTPDQAKAAELYEALHREHPETFWGQFALLKWSVLQMHVLTDEASKTERLLELEKRLPQVKVEAVRRNFLLLLAECHQLYGGLSDERALDYLNEAWQIGFSKRDSQRECLLKAIHLADKSGQLEKQQAAMEAFVKRFPKDVWAYMISLELDALRQGVER